MGKGEQQHWPGMGERHLPGGRPSPDWVNQQAARTSGMIDA